MSIGLLTRYGLTKAPGEGGASYTDPLITTLATLNNSTGAVQVGWQFTVAAAGDLVAGKLRAIVNHSSGTETVRLWRVSDQALLGSVVVTPVAGEWVEGDLASPVTLASGVSYVVSTRATSGASRSYKFNSFASSFVFSSRITSVTQGRFISSDGFPTSTAGGVFGVADVLVEPA